MNPCWLKLIVQMQWLAVLRVYPHRLNRGCWRSIPRCHSVLHARSPTELSGLLEFSCLLRSVAVGRVAEVAPAEVMVAVGAGVVEVIHLKLPSPVPLCWCSPALELFLPATANTDFRALLQPKSRELQETFKHSQLFSAISLFRSPRPLRLKAWTRKYPAIICAVLVPQCKLVVLGAVRIC